MDIVDSIIKKIQDIIKDKDFLDAIGTDIVFIFKGTTRTGKNIAGKKFKFKNKKKATMRREKIAKYNPTHEVFSPGRANVTITGELVDSITHKVDSNSSAITITVEGDHKGYRNKNGTTGKTVPNKKILKGLQEKGFTILIESEKINEKITKKIKEELRRRLKNKIS